MAYKFEQRDPLIDGDGVVHCEAESGRRAIEAVELVDQGRYVRTVRVECGGKHHIGWIAARKAKRSCTIEVLLSASLAAAVPSVLARVKRLFDLSCNPDEIALVLGPLAARHPGLRLPGAFDGFELAVRAILGQQITVNAARTLAGRFTAGFGEAVQTPYPSVRRLFPSAEQVAALTPAQLAPIGVTSARASAIVSLARAVCEKGLVLEPGGEAESTLRRLRDLPGIGEWTAQYIAMRGLSWPNAFPHTDHGVLKALGESNARKALTRASAWQPWRAYAVMHLWQSLEGANR